MESTLDAPLSHPIGKSIKWQKKTLDADQRSTRRSFHRSILNDRLSILLHVF